MSSRSRLMILLAGLLLGVILIALTQRVLMQGDPTPTPILGVYDRLDLGRPYDAEVARSSQYVATRDGTRLAVDIYRPLQNGVVVEEPLPVIWIHTRYHRAVVENGEIVNTHRYYVYSFVPSGYVVAVVDARGTGASFGARLGEYTPAEAQDAYDITEWLAAQPWSDGNIGMAGGSYTGTTQMFAASQAPPHLRAIFPCEHLFDRYHDADYPNGIFMRVTADIWVSTVSQMDSGESSQPAPVDEDTDGSLLAAALAEHTPDIEISPEQFVFPYRDSRYDPALVEQFAALAGYDGPADEAMPHVIGSPHTYLDAINASGVAVYQIGGWYDGYPAAELRWFANLDTPNRLVIVPEDHQAEIPAEVGVEDAGLPAWWRAVEMFRWYDYWLKGIDNGIMDEPRLTYYVLGANEWHTADQWPLPNEQRVPVYFRAGPSGTMTSSNDGLLSFDAPADAEGSDDYSVDYATTLGPNNRFAVTMGGGVWLGRVVDYSGLAAHDERALTYTSAPLDAAMEITGHPVAHLWVTSTADDGDFFVYLEEVRADGSVIYISEGCLRASHRALHEPPFDNLGLPWHRSYAEDLAPLPEGEPVELAFDLTPTSRVLRAGSRIRVAITGADADTFGTPQFDPPPMISIYRSAVYPSFVELPVIPAQ